MTPTEVHTQKSTIGRAHPIQLLNRGLSAIAPRLAAMAAEQLFVTVFRHKTPRREEAWARGAMKITIPTPRGDLAAWVWGSGPKTVLLIHGWAGRGLQLGAFAAPLVAAGNRVVAYDGPAHGASPGRQVNLFMLTEGLVAVAKAVGPLSGVIAHSLGTTAVLLASSRGELDPGRFVAIAPMANTRTMSDLYGRMTGFSPAVVERMRERLEKRYGFRWDDIEPMRVAPKVRAPTLVIHDRDDSELMAHESEELVRSMSNGTIRLTRGLGHRRILRDSDVGEIATTFINRAEPHDLVMPSSSRTQAVSAA